MSVYLIALTVVFAYSAGHAVASWWHTREWFYRWSAPVMGLSALVTGTLAAWVT